ncbi:MAG: GDP-L-fucose synthase [Alphaproteobacteria bacterium]|nr:GDP-L-fucose synthase [Alphaproteobacteria bacterium]
MSDGWLREPYPLKNKHIWIAGHTGMVGAALMRAVSQESCEILSVPSSSLDLRDQSSALDWIISNHIDVILIAAATVGGIAANQNRPADFLYDNLMIAANIIHAAHKANVGKLLFLGSSCIYPRGADNPIPEDALLSGPLEPTNEAYAIAKIAGIKLCQSYRRQHGCDFISAMPCNLYGPGDTYDAENSHVIPALLMKAHEAKTSGARSLTVWGSGTPRREFLHVDDLARALLFLLKNYSGEKPVNVGAGEDITITDLARLVADTVGFEGRVAFDPSRPDGVLRKLMDSSRITRAGWRTEISLEEGLEDAYRDYLSRF